MLPHCCCRYTNIYVGRPSLEEDYIQASAATVLVAACFSHWREAGTDTSTQADAALSALVRAHLNLMSLPRPHSYSADGADAQPVPPARPDVLSTHHSGCGVHAVGAGVLWEVLPALAMPAQLLHLVFSVAILTGSLL